MGREMQLAGTSGGCEGTAVMQHFLPNNSEESSGFCQLLLMIITALVKNVLLFANGMMFAKGMLAGSFGYASPSPNADRASVNARCLH